MVASEARSSRRPSEQVPLEQAVGRAIDRRELRVVYQPIHDVVTRKLVGFEALVRFTAALWGDLPAPEIIHRRL